MRLSLVFLTLASVFLFSCSGDDGGDGTSGTTGTGTSSSGTTSDLTGTTATTGMTNTTSATGSTSMESTGDSSSGGDDGLFPCDDAGKVCDPDAAQPCREGTMVCLDTTEPPDSGLNFNCAEPCSNVEPCSIGECHPLGFCWNPDSKKYAGQCSGMPMCGGDPCNLNMGCGGGLVCFETHLVGRPPSECLAKCDTIADCPASAESCLQNICYTDEPYDVMTSDWLADNCG